MILSLWMLTCTDAGDTEVALFKKPGVPTQKFPHGKPIFACYEGYNGQPNNYGYAAIYKESKKMTKGLLTVWPPDEQFKLWLNLCNTQDTCELSGSNVPSSGCMKFSTDPYCDSDDYESYAPLNAGKYRVCIITETWDDPSNNPTEALDWTLESCSRFTVKNIPKKHLKNVKVTVTDAFKANATSLSVTVSVPKRQPNQWLGLWRQEDFVDEGKPLPDEIAWVYTNCDGQEGDGDNVNSCSNKKGKVKRVSIDVSHADKESLNPIWTDAKPPSGIYKVCVVLQSNAPFNRYKCSDPFEV